MQYGNSIPFSFFLGKGWGEGGVAGDDETTMFVFFILGCESVQPLIFALKEITKHI